MGGELQYVPWLLSLVTAVWFAWMARKAERSVVQWTLTGAVFGLVMATIVLGLGLAMNNPFSDYDRTRLHIKLAVVAAVLIAVVGWLMTAGLHRHHLTLWRRATGTPPPPAKDASAPRPQAKAEPPKSPADKR